MVRRVAFTFGDLPMEHTAINGSALRCCGDMGMLDAVAFGVDIQLKFAVPGFSDQDGTVRVPSAMKPPP